MTYYATIYTAVGTIKAGLSTASQPEALALFTQNGIHPLLIRYIESDNGDIDYYYEEPDIA